MSACEKNGYVYLAVDNGRFTGDPVWGINTNLMMFNAGMRLVGLAAKESPDFEADLSLRHIELIDARACDALQIGLVRNDHPALLTLDLPPCSIAVESAKATEDCPSWAFIHVSYSGDRGIAVAAIPDAAGAEAQARHAEFLLQGMLQLSARNHLKMRIDPEHPERAPVGGGRAGTKLAEESNEQAHCGGQLWVKRTAKVVQTP